MWGLNGYKLAKNIFFKYSIYCTLQKVINNTQAYFLITLATWIKPGSTAVFQN